MTTENNFQSLREIISANQETEGSKLLRTSKCTDCGDEFERFSGIFPRQLCNVCQKKWERVEIHREQEELAIAIKNKKISWINKSGIPYHLKTKTFDNFKEKRAPASCKMSYEWAQGFNIDNARGYPSLIFYSEVPGVGKTHLMIAIANAIIDNWQGDPRGILRPIRFESGPGLVRRIRSTYNLPPGSDHEREQDVFNELRGVKLLLLDDVGKETPSKATREIYWYLIDQRMNEGLPVIITTRIPLETGPGTLEDLMGEDTVDRLFGMIQGKYYIHMKGKSYRRLEKSV